MKKASAERTSVLHASKTEELFAKQNDTGKTKPCHAFTHERTDQINLLNIAKEFVSFNHRRMTV